MQSHVMWPFSLHRRGKRGHRSTTWRRNADRARLIVGIAYQANWPVTAGRSTSFRFANGLVPTSLSCSFTSSIFARSGRAGSVYGPGGCACARFR